MTQTFYHITRRAVATLLPGAAFESPHDGIRQPASTPVFAPQVSDNEPMKLSAGGFGGGALKGWWERAALVGRSLSAALAARLAARRSTKRRVIPALLSYFSSPVTSVRGALWRSG